MGDNWNRDWSGASKNFNEAITPRVRSHLVNVYVALALCCGAAAGGAAVGPMVPGGALVWGLVALGMLLWLRSSRGSPRNTRRLGLLAFGAAQGLSISDLLWIVGMGYGGDRILMLALLSTLAIFVCFSGSALLARRRSYLYLGGFLSSALSVLLLLSFFGGRFFDIQLYGGLVIFSLFVIFDTQLIVERASTGVLQDEVIDAAELFMDLLSIFIRIIVILLKNRESQERRGGSSGGNKRSTQTSYSSTRRR